MVAYAIDAIAENGKMVARRNHMNGSWLAVCYAVAVQVFLLLGVVIIVDTTSWIKGLPSITETIRGSWLSWPVGLMAALVFGTVVLSHFAPTDLPGK